MQLVGSYIDFGGALDPIGLVALEFQIGLQRRLKLNQAVALDDFVIDEPDAQPLDQRQQFIERFRVDQFIGNCRVQLFVADPRARNAQLQKLSKRGMHVGQTHIHGCLLLK